MPTTRRSLLLEAHRPTPEGREALATLCRLYWYPVYAYVRRRGHEADQASDLTQGFFARLLETHDFAVTDPRRGRFRSWLLASVNHYLANDWDRERAQKRGGLVQVSSIDRDDAEGRYRLEPSHDLTPEKLYVRQWMQTVIERVSGALESECARSGRIAVFQKLKPTLTGELDRSYAQVGAELGMTEGAVKVAVHRLRQRHAALLNAEIADTVQQEDDVEGEIRSLLAEYE
ncbi:MAG: RNA polymerase sigma factor [Myxococcaceae bacterium]